ncbi:TIGR02281 family clan AA aspartic protease [Aquamicrobium sp. LC103]|uniref:TIGR02281 family clan AA aspartic protease n=1 Tax=Aquamicrobium sp. LC103 TaxID=1120658 RepID=UPI00063EBABC|nr:TIGR02281 family clan AA aspartic protease [Aquamicrobium sp. LC103]TKT74900.1 TIGR02281 family clan AA aspartic protease [Aquamicrobium sp. LC103]
MLQKLVMAGTVAAMAAFVPILHESNPALLEGLMRLALGGEPAPAPVSAVVKHRDAIDGAAQILPGRKVRLASDRSGHFTSGFKLNGRNVEAMIDTGATYVAINRSTARRIGLDLASSDFRHEIDTANGRTRAAGAMIDRIQIGRIDLADVQAVVLEDSALSGTLIGISFLSRLKSYRVEQGALVMEQ